LSQYIRSNAADANGLAWFRRNLNVAPRVV